MNTSALRAISLLLAATAATALPIADAHASSPSTNPVAVANGVLGQLENTEDGFVTAFGVGMTADVSMIADNTLPPSVRKDAAQRLYDYGGAFLGAVTGALEECDGQVSTICDRAAEFEDLLDDHLVTYAAIDTDSSAFVLDTTRWTSAVVGTLRDMPLSSYLEYDNQALIWQGFSHAWTYNHRVNRLGNWVSGKALNCNSGLCKGKANHAGSSGSGPDRLEWASNYTFVNTPSAEFEHVVTDPPLRIAAEEGYFDSDEHEFVVHTGTENSAVVLRGFDIVANVSADKLRKLAINVRNEGYDPITGNYTFTLYAGGRFDCKSPECWLEDRYDFDVKVYATVISGEEGEFLATERPSDVSHSYSWEDNPQFLGIDLPGPSREEFRSDHVVSASVQGAGGGQYPVAAMAYKSIMVDLDDDHHLLELDVNMTPDGYDPQDGRYHVDMGLFFKQWSELQGLNMFTRLQEFTNNPSLFQVALVFLVPTPIAVIMASNMLATTVSPGGGVLSFCALDPVTAGQCVLEDPGEADFDVKPVLLQFAEGVARSGSEGGENHWLGLGESAKTSVAESEAEILEVY